MKFLLVALVVAAGLGNPVQSAGNAALNKAIGQVLPAAVAIYGVALCGVVVCSLFMGVSLRGLGTKALGAPWWAWLGGLSNLLFVLAAALTTRKIGSAVFTVTTASCAIVMSIVFDRFGIMGLPPHPLTVLRVLGGAMAVGGIALVSIS